MHLLAPFSKPKSHEELFLEHYSSLVERALQITRKRRDEANDLVHDLYVLLIRTRPDIDLSDDDRVRGYLYTMLRNLSVSKARRAGLDALSSLLIVDYESVEYGLACVDRSRLILVRSDLARVCEYASIRRDTSRSASVLILRFFFGYYPSEIARILQVTRVAVEKHLQAAREEARVYLERPGKTTTYAKGRGLQSGDEPPAAIVDRNNAWEMVPGAEAFSALAAVGEQPTLRRVNDGYDFEYEKGQIRRNSGTVEASLVLDGSTLRPVSETVSVQTGSDIREYRFQRLTYEVVPGNEERDSDFAPDAALASLHSGLTALPDVANRTAQLALQAIQLLSNLGPDIESVVDLDRLPDGSVQISGVLPTKERKAAIVHVLRSLRSNGQLKLALHSSDELSEATVQRTAITVESLAPIAVDGEHIPLDPEIRSALSAQGLSGSTLDERIHEIASDTLGHAARMHREAWTICQITANDFSPNEIRLMPPEDKILWLTLLDKHIRSLGQELSSLDADLKPMVRDPSAGPPSAPSASPPLRSVDELTATAKAMSRDGERLDRLLTAGLTLSASSLPTNHNVAEIAELLADLRIEESMLHATVERLQTASSYSHTQ